MKGIQVKMKTVMICLNPFISHVVPTFELAKRLEKKNINIIYVGPEELKENVIEKNFAYRKRRRMNGRGSPLSESQT